MKEFSHLVEAAQAGDRESYAALAQCFQGMAYALAYSYVGDHHLAQDLVKEVSALLKIPITTVKKRLHSARQKLRMPLQVTLRDEIEQANAYRARKEEAAERAGRAIHTARWLKRGASTLAWEAARPSSSNVNGTHVCLPRVA